MKNQIFFSLFLFVTFCATPVFAQEKSNSKNQCEMYINNDFIGSPINVEFVDTNIRDVVNYFTEQFGCEFIIDEFNGYFPINTKIENVPWTIVLKSVLTSQGFDIMIKQETDKTTNMQKSFLYIATKEKIRSEYERLNLLYTEIIRLKNLPICPNDTKCEQPSIAFDRLKKFASRRLSRRGTIEFDERSQTLVVTDMRANVDNIKAVIGLLDTDDFYNKTDEDFFKENFKP